jgi:Na+/H+-dicarboxylate symporter
LLALAAGLALGALGHRSASPVFGAIEGIAGPLGTAWVTVLHAAVLPLVITHLLAAITSARGSGAVGSSGARAVLLFLAMLLGAGAVTLLVVPWLVRLYSVDPAVMASLARSVTVPEGARTAASGATILADPVSGFLPRNLFRAAAEGQVLPLLLFTALFGVAVTRLPPEQRDPLALTFQALAAAMLLLVRWVLVLTPLGVFSFIYAFALEAGTGAIGPLGAFVAIQCALLLLCTGLLYPVSAYLGRTRALTFARAVAPAQVVAVSTRSSTASLPALIEGARLWLRLPRWPSGSCFRWRTRCSGSTVPCPAPPSCSFSRTCSGFLSARGRSPSSCSRWC